MTTLTPSKQKWFYPLQAKAIAYLMNNYEDHSCNWQEVGKEIVHENYRCTKDQATKFVHVIMNKRGIVAIYEMQSIFHI